MATTATHNGPIVVLAGGLSHEREVSLRSGRRVAQALRDQGRQVIEADVNAELVGLFETLDNPVAFPLLHGGVGEDGGLQQVLELLHVRYVGSTPEASRRSFNKAVCAPLAAKAGIAIPKRAVLPHDMFRELGAQHLIKALGRHVGYPMMVKPAQSGSALGASKVEVPAEVPQAMVAAFAYGDVAIVEEFISGREMAAAVIEVGGAAQALPIVEIQPNSGVYDYTARYTAGATRFIAPAELDADVAAACADMALAAHRELGLRHISRTDLILRDDGTPVFIEVNSAPGMTETSLVPLAVEAAGLDFGSICAQLVDAAAA
ncbi:MAG: D-alanine--D-alanine ligase [Propionibacteriaceae bacterium]|jgi:D-alanine-D-alanine ligase|nr:D-alanine--D-alanine ligase [Propionibacteriaceae bacterium]